MSESIFSRVLVLLQSSGPEGIRTDILAKQAGTSGMVLNNYIKRHRQAGAEIHTLPGIHCPATLYARKEWHDAAKAARQAKSAARLKERERKRSREQAELAAIRRAKAQAEAAARKALYAVVQKSEPKPQPKPEHARPHVGPLPAAHVLPIQPVYSRHQLTDLPPGWQSPLNASECRPWAMMVGQR